MPTWIDKPTMVEAAGEPPKQIAEYFGRVNSGDEAYSIAVMRSPAGWSEPGQRPEFEELTVVLEGSLKVETETATRELQAGQACKLMPGEWVRYSTPNGPAVYVAVCLPAFSPATVHRDS